MERDTNELVARLSTAAGIIMDVRTGEIIASLSGIAVVVLMYVAAERTPQVINPGLSAWPPLSALALVAVMIGVVPAFLTPEPVLDSAEVHA